MPILSLKKVRRSCCAIGPVQFFVRAASTNVGGSAARLLHSRLQKGKRLEHRMRIRIRLELEKRKADCTSAIFLAARC